MIATKVAAAPDEPNKNGQSMPPVVPMPDVLAKVSEELKRIREKAILAVLANNKNFTVYKVSKTLQANEELAFDVKTIPIQELVAHMNELKNSNYAVCTPGPNEWDITEEGMKELARLNAQELTPA